MEWKGWGLCGYALGMNQACHQCGYELTGLADRGSCPECGEAYDVHSVYRAHQQREPAILRHLKWLMLASFTLMVLICGGVLSINAERPWGAVALTLIVASVSGFGSFTYWWIARQEKRESA